MTDLQSIDSNSYPLPDKKLLETSNLPAFCTWIPDQVYVVLGRSNQPEKSVFLERIEQDEVALIKRPSGGEAVVLSPSMVIIACTDSKDNYERSVDFFARCNNLIINALTDLGIENLGQRGISDISSGSHKILGSSMFKAPDRLFYHAVLNVSELPGTIAWYLKHPTREPDYRAGRDHTKFVTSLKDLGYNSGIQPIIIEITKNFTREFKDITIL